MKGGGRISRGGKERREERREGEGRGRGGRSGKREEGEEGLFKCRHSCFGLVVSEKYISISSGSPNLERAFRNLPRAAS